MTNIDKALYKDIWRLIKPLRGKMIISTAEKHSTIDELVKYFKENVKR